MWNEKSENGGMTRPPHVQGQSTLSELFAVVYVLVDDYPKASACAGNFKLPRAANQQGSYGELIAIALVGKLRSQTHVGNWFDFVKVEYARLFPKSPHQARYYHVLNQLGQVFADFALRFSEGDSLYVIDSKPATCLSRGTLAAA